MLKKWWFYLSNLFELIILILIWRKFGLMCNRLVVEGKWIDGFIVWLFEIWYNIFLICEGVMWNFVRMELMYIIGELEREEYNFV